MEIIHLVLGKANPNRMNGVNKVVYQLATRQAASGQSVSVWGIAKDLTQNFGERNFSTQLFKASPNPFGLPGGIEKAFSQKKGKAVVHVHGGWIPVFSGISTLLKKAEIPFVFTPHGAYNQVAMQRSKFLKKLYFNYFEKRLLRNSSRIHCLGASEVKGLTSLFTNQKTVLLPYGYCPETDTQIHSEVNSNKFVIGFIGRLDVYTKGLDLLVDAFQKFHTNHPDSELWLVGDGPERPAFEKEIFVKGWQKAIKFFGPRFGAEKEQILAQMDVFAHPSRNEGLPASILEAASFRIPLLVTEATNLADLVRKYDCGIAVNDGDTKALAQAMKQFFTGWQKKENTAMGERAKAMVQQEFNWDSILQRFNHLYASL